MKLINFIFEGAVCLGVYKEQGVVNITNLSRSISGLPSTMEQILCSDNQKEFLIRVQTAADNAKDFIKEKDLIYAPCVQAPSKILCVGLNYKKHIEECVMTSPAHPTIFSKLQNTLAAHKQNIPLGSFAVQYDYEAELVIVIGKEGKNITRERAGSYIFGYTAGNDFTARDIQFQTSQWLLGKSLDFFAPIGPCIVTADEVDHQNLDITCSVNGQIYQTSNTSNMIFDCESIVSYISQFMTLKPGDIIFSGTPEGVIMGMPESEQKWLKPDDLIEVTIEKIGTLANKLVRV